MDKLDRVIVVKLILNKIDQSTTAAILVNYGKII